MRACPHGDARVRDLIAELLWFHQRSQKPGWWALFERQAWSEDELVDDAESLGGLQLDTNTPPVQVKRSLDTAYVFPPQDTKLKVGDTPRIAETLGYAGSIVELSAEDGRIVLRRGMKSGAMPERLQPRTGADQSANRARRRDRLCRSLRSRADRSGSGLARHPDAPRAAPQRTRGWPAGPQSRRAVDRRRDPRRHGPRPQLSLHSGAAGHRQDLHGRAGHCCAAARRQARRRLLKLAQGDQQAAQRSGGTRR